MRKRSSSNDSDAKTDSCKILKRQYREDGLYKFAPSTLPLVSIAIIRFDSLRDSFQFLAEGALPEDVLCARRGRGFLAQRGIGGLPAKVVKRKLFFLSPGVQRVDGLHEHDFKLRMRGKQIFLGMYHGGQLVGKIALRSESLRLNSGVEHLLYSVASGP